MTDLTPEERAAFQSRHESEKHPMTTIPELGTLTIYYGKGSFEDKQFYWCAECRQVFIVSTAHGHGIREPRDTWQRKVADSQRAMIQKRTEATAYRDERRKREAA